MIAACLSRSTVDAHWRIHDFRFSTPHQLDISPWLGGKFEIPNPKFEMKIEEQDTGSRTTGKFIITFSCVRSLVQVHRRPSVPAFQPRSATKSGNRTPTPKSL